MKRLQRCLTTVAVVFIGVICHSPALAATVQLWTVSADPTSVRYALASPYSEGKTPLLVIHGVNTHVQSPEIKVLTDKLASDSTVTAKFQVFTLEYDTFAGIEDNALAFAEHLPRILGDRRFLIIGHSMGGLVARGALELHGGDGAGSLMDRLHVLITLGTPHHGSPVANEGWTRATAAKDPLLPFLLSSAERAAGLAFSSAGVKDLAWDDFDGLTPAPFKAANSAFLAKLNATFQRRADAPGQKYHFIGGLATTLPKALSPLLASPNDKSLQYRTLGWLIGRLMPEDPANSSLLANDGIVPLSSSLFLNAPAASSVPLAHLVNEETTAPQGY